MVTNQGPRKTIGYCFKKQWILSKMALFKQSGAELRIQDDGAYESVATEEKRVLLHECYFRRIKECYH